VLEQDVWRKKSVTRRRDSRKAKLGSIQPFPPKDMLALVPGSLLKKRGGRREPGNIYKKSCWLSVPVWWY